MFQLDLERAADLYGDEWLGAAAWYRANSLAVVDDADLVLRHLSHPAVAQKIAAEFAAARDGGGARLRAEMFEALSYGDAGFLLTTPGPSLSGVLIETLGDEEQQTFFRPYVTEHRCRTFFAVTEPARGSDAANLTTSYRRGVLNGEKLLVGNGAVAPLGTVLARTGDRALDSVALLLTPDLVASDAVSGRVLEMFGMRGAQLSHLLMEGLNVPETLVLGRHLRAPERGLMGILKTFNRFRPSVAAMAIGHAQAVVDYARRYMIDVSDLAELLERFDHELLQVRALNLAAADEVDKDPLRSALVSLAKQRATAVAEAICVAMGRRLPVERLVEHPWLTKALADVYAFEFMEGTTAIQLDHVRNGFLRNEIGV